MTIIFYLIFSIFILLSIAVFIYDIVFTYIKHMMRPETKCVHSFVVWVMCFIEMIVLYKLGIRGIKFLLIPDIIVVIFFIGLLMQVYTVAEIIKHKNKYFLDV